MFQFNDQVHVQGEMATVLSTAGHNVTVRYCGGREQTFPEHEVQRVRPPAKAPKSRVDMSLDWDIICKLKKPLLTLPLDWRGHHQNGTLWANKHRWFQKEPERRNQLATNLGIQYGDNIVISREDAQTIITAIESSTPLDRFIPVFTGNSYSYSGCPYCPSKQGFETDGSVLRPTEPCPHPNGLVTEFDLNVPSGMVVINDDLRDLCRIASKRDINTRYGVHLAILDYANNGLACGFGIGNTCPTVARQKGGVYTIGHRQGGRKVASICTDLWAYSIMDYDEALKRSAYYGVEIRGDIVKIPAGLYRFQHFHNVDRDRAKALFASFSRVGDALPPEDWCARDRAFTVDITQAVQAKVKARSTLFGGPDWEAQCYNVFRSEFGGCVPDRDWHQNGHRNDYLAQDIEGVSVREIPHFRFQGHWSIDRSVIDTTVSRNDDLFGGDIPFNPSYAVAAGRILESAISFGLTPLRNVRTGESNIDLTRANMHKAASLWHGLVDRYPHVAEENAPFHAWMQDREAVARWIDGMELGEGESW